MMNRWLGAPLLLSCAGLALASVSCGSDNSSWPYGTTSRTTHTTSGGTGGGTTGGTTGGTGGGAQGCAPCLTSAGCGAGMWCAQLAGDTYCAADCTGGQACPEGTVCTPASTTEGHAVSVCVASTNPCGGGAGSSTPRRRPAAAPGDRPARRRAAARRAPARRRAPPAPAAEARWAPGAARWTR